MRYSTLNQTVSHHGVYDLVRDINDDVHALRDTQYEFQREASKRLNSLELSIDKLKADNSTLMQDVAVLKDNVVTLKDDVNDIRRELSDIHGEVKLIAGCLSGMQSRLNWWLIIAGIIFAALQYWKS